MARTAAIKRSFAFFLATTMAPVALANAAEFAGYLVLTSDYVYRGVTYSDSKAAAQVGADISFDGGFYFGAWGSTIDINERPDLQRDVEIKYYLGHSYEIGKNWTLGANAIAFRYPRAKGTFDYDYEELTVSANYRDRAWLEYSYSPDIYHSGQSTRNLSLLSEWPLANHFRLSAGVGHYDVSDLSGSDYAYWQMGLTRPFGVVDFDLRYHGTSAWVPIVSTADRADDRVALSIRFQF